MALRSYRRPPAEGRSTRFFLPVRERHRQISEGETLFMRAEDFILVKPARG